MKRMTGLLATILVAALTAQGGVLFTIETTGEGGRGAEMQNMTVKGAVEGDKGRFMFEESKNPALSEGAYLITHNGGDVMYLVKPDEKTYMKWDMEEMMNMAGGFMKAAKGMLSMNVTDHEVEKLSDKKGPKLLGMPTRHLKFRTSYTMETTVFGMKNSTQTVRHDEMWVTKAMDDAALAAWGKQRTMTTGNEELDKLLKAQVMDVDGFPLKSVVKTTNTGKNGQEETMTVTTEVTKLNKTNVADELFRIPDGYEEVKMEQAMQEQEGGIPTSEKPESSKDAPDFGKFLKMFQK